ncbi:epididymal protein 13 [Pteropus medius]|uniref:epididymal protein 13 n=1 Tax=Pteropus vampyrus TaxID=132908 RepID=UPI00196A74A5|nr:epididymal protein 13 [Pteropus giganteus]
MHSSEPLLKMALPILLFLGLAEACIPREGLLSLQVLSEETNDCKEEERAGISRRGGNAFSVSHFHLFLPVKLLPTTIPTKKPPKKRNKWNLLKCAYMMVTFLFVSYNKGDWCYCHYCNPEVDIRNDPCCSFY